MPAVETTQWIIAIGSLGSALVAEHETNPRADEPVLEPERERERFRLRDPT